MARQIHAVFPKMSVLSYLNPSRAAALSIARELMAEYPRRPDDAKRRLQQLGKKNPRLYKLVLQEMAKYGFGIPGLS